MSVNVFRTDQVEVMAVEEMGRIDIPVNNAGGSGNVAIADLEDVNDEAWDGSLDLNLKGTFLCCRAAVPHMRRQGGGRIMNVSSGSAYGTFGPLGPQGARIPYAAGKAGVLGFKRQLAYDLAPESIYVNVIIPGFILTEPGVHVHDRYQALPEEENPAGERTFLSAGPAVQTS